MTPNLPKELSDALHSSSDSKSLEIVDPSDNRIYFIVDDETHKKAMQALREQEDLEAIQEGIDQANRGETMPIEEFDARMRSKHDFLNK